MDNSKQMDDLRFDLLRNAIYHTARRQFLDRCMRITNFFVIILGASAATDLMSRHVGAKWLAAAAAIVATLQLVADFAVSARDHGYLQRRCYELLSELESLEPNEEQKIASIRAKLTILYGEEPPQMRALDAIAYNAACDSIGKSNARVKIDFLHSLLRHICPFNGTEFEYVQPKQTARIS
ncbi:MAG: hypothetical protein J2P49_10310 [Methylocapsa sp.]|nr:hypothetical protein [Methylocapsa sp.]